MTDRTPTNPGAVEAGLAALDARQSDQGGQDSSETVDEDKARRLEETRQSLEAPSTPDHTHGSESIGELDGFEDDQDDHDGAEDELLDVEDAGPDERPDVFERRESRRVGTVSITVDGEPVPFAKPSGRASTQMLDPIAAMEDDQAPISDLGGYVWETLAEWTLDDDRDVDHWADEYALMDAIVAARSLAMGGNPNLG